MKHVDVWLPDHIYERLAKNAPKRDVGRLVTYLINKAVEEKDKGGGTE